MRKHHEPTSNLPYLREIHLERQKVTSFTSYPFSLPAIHRLQRLAFHPSVTFLIGENGTGKSTLLEAIAEGLGFNPEGGSRNFRFATRPSHSPLERYLRLVRSTTQPRDGFFLRAESFFNLATEIEGLDQEGGGARIIDAYGGKSLHEQSHGESFLATFQHRFRGHGLYILDEPEAALSPMWQLAFLTRLHQLVKLSSQFIIATHSPILMAYPNARRFMLTSEGIKETAYQETEHFTVTQAFLNRPEQMLRILMNEESPEEVQR